MLEIYNINIKRLQNLSYKKYISYIRQKYPENNFIKQVMIKDLDLDTLLLPQNLVNIKTDITEKYLHKLNIHWPIIDSNYVQSYLNNRIGIN